MTLIKARSITRKYGELEVLKEIDIDIDQKEIVAIVGPSGAGKTTLLQILGTLDKPDKGSVYLEAVELGKLSAKKLKALRRSQVGFIFQFHNLMAELTALENVCLPAWIAGHDEKKTVKAAEDLLETLGILQRASHLPSELSGGEQQRVAVARALINKPKIIFADEPTGNLDSKNAEDLHQFFLEIRNNFDCSFVIVTHNKQLANLADRVITLKDGEIQR